MVTATITNVVRENKGIRVFAEFSNDVGNARTYVFDTGVDSKTITDTIQKEVDFENSLDKEVGDLKVILVGTVIETKSIEAIKVP